MKFPEIINPILCPARFPIPTASIEFFFSELNAERASEIFRFGTKHGRAKMDGGRPSSVKCISHESELCFARAHLSLLPFPPMSIWRLHEYAAQCLGTSKHSPCYISNSLDVHMFCSTEMEKPRGKRNNCQQTTLPHNPAMMYVHLAKLVKGIHALQESVAQLDGYSSRLWNSPSSSCPKI